MSTPNFEITTTTGEKYWISRAVTVVGFIFRWNGLDLEVLCEKRGKAVSDTGKYCCPCGYLDWDETCEQAVRREVKEETGFTLGKVDFMGYNSDPEGDARQNIGMRFIGFISAGEGKPDEVETKDEIDAVIWHKIGIWDPKQQIIYIYENLIGEYEWAFGHDKLIPEMLQKFYSQERVMRTVVVAKQ